MVAGIISICRQHLNRNDNLMYALSEMAFHLYEVLFFVVFHCKRVNKKDATLCFVHLMKPSIHIIS